MTQDNCNHSAQNLFISRIKVLVVTLMFEGGLGIIALMIGKFLSHPATETLNFSLSEFFFGCLAAVPLVVLFYAFCQYPVGPLAKIRQFLDQIVRPLLANSSVFELAIISLFAGWGEELLFRGVLQNIISLKLGIATGCVVASVLFGLAHLITPTYAVVAGIIGVYLGWIWIITGNLLVPILAHSFYDFIALVIFLKYIPPASHPLDERTSQNL